MTTRTEPRPPLAAASITLALLSAAAIGLQIALIRALSVDTYHHFTYLVIGTALLGFGAGGTALSLLNRYRPGWWRLGAPLSLTLFTLSVAYSYRLSLAVRPDLHYLLYRFAEVGKLWLSALVLFLPFFFAGLFVGLVLYLFRDRPGPVYGINMIASGLGAGVGVALTAAVGGPRALDLLSLAAALATLLWIVGSRKRPFLASEQSGPSAPESENRTWLFLLPLIAIAGSVATLFLPEATRIDQYKAMAQAQRLAEQGAAEHVLSSPSATVRLDLYRAETMRQTLFAAPMAPPPPEQDQLFLDAYHGGALFRIETPAEAEILESVPQSLPYSLLEEPTVLLLGETSGTNIWLALKNGAKEVTVVQPNRAITKAVLSREEPPFDRPEVRVITIDPRTYLERAGERFDLIQLVSAEGVPAAAGGLASLREEYLLTVEAMELALGRLSESGVLAVTRGLQTPPRDSIRLFALLTEAATSIGDPGTRLVQGHNYLSSTTLLSAAPWSERALSTLRARAESLSMDLDYYPGIQPGEVTDRALIPGPEGEAGSYLHHAALSLLSQERDSFLDRWVYNVRPTTDDRPYFHNFFKLSSLGRFSEAYGTTWFQRVELGVVVTVITLLQVGVAGVVLIMLPLLWLREGRAGVSEKWWTVIHFGAIGTGFMLLEMLFIQRLTRFLGAPIYATAVVLASILFFSGLGSALQQRMRLSPQRRMRLGALLLLALILAAELGLDPALSAAVELSLPWRIVTALLLLGPVSLLLGVQMPAGLERLAAGHRELIPFAWAVNGVASVVAAPLAVLLAVNAGFLAVSAVAVACYGVVYLVSPVQLGSG